VVKILNGLSKANLLVLARNEMTEQSITKHTENFTMEVLQTRFRIIDCHKNQRFSRNDRAEAWIATIPQVESCKDEK